MLIYIEEVNEMKLKTKSGKSYDTEDLVIRGVDSSEQETTIVALRNDDYMDVYTSDNTYLTKLKKLAATNPKEWSIIEVYEGRAGINGVKFRAPKNLLTLRTGTTERSITDEQRQVLRDRLKQAREKSAAQEQS